MLLFLCLCKGGYLETICSRYWYWNCIDKCSVLKCVLLGKVSERMNEKQIKLVIAGVTSVVGLFKVIVQHRGQVKKEKKYVQGDSERV